MKRLWYQSAATMPEETLPLGNGSLGAMIWGDALKERIDLNHERLWSGWYADHNPKHAAEHLEEVRKLIYQKHYSEAERLMEQHFLGEYTESYMPAGVLHLELDESEEEITDYQRQLILDEATAEVSFRLGKEATKFTKQYLTSYPRKALIIRYCCEKPFTLHIAYESQLICREIKKGVESLSYHMQCPEHVDPNYLGERPDAVIWGDKGLQFYTNIHVLETDGNVSVDETLNVTKATYLTIAVSIYDALVEEELPKQKVFAALKAEHLEDFQRIYQRVELEIEDSEATEPPTDVWRENPTPGLYALYFQYGRYLLISSSREGGLPANLQGIWSWQMRAPWSSNWTTNINLEMNYWPALAANLLECDLPYIDMVRKLCEEGKKTAAAYGMRGSCCGHNTDGHFATNPVGVARGEEEGKKGCLLWAFWLMAEVWMDQEVWGVYRYHPNETYLKETVYPLLKESVQFCLDYLTEYEGYYVTCPATTPENQFLQDGKRISVSLATTMDMTLIRELFRNFKAASEKLGKTELIEQIETVTPKLYPPVILEDGSLCEWYEEKEEVEPGHRHLSHLYGLFPSDLWRGDDKLKEACRHSLEKRMAAGSGHTGWSLAWVINLYVVLQEAEKAEAYLEQMMRRSSYPNLWSRHPPFQIDGNFGVTAAIAHMLVEESDAEEVHLLPCLPPSWKAGRVKGLRLPGGRQVSFAWENGKVTESKIEYDL